MLRLFATLVSLVAAKTSVAEDFLIRGDISSATLYAGVAEVERLVELDVPQGSHRLLVAIPGASNLTGLTFTTESEAEVGMPQPLVAFPITLGALDTPEQAVARGAVEGAVSQLRTTEDALARHEATVEAKELQIDYLRAIAGGSPDGASMPDDPDALTAQL